MSGKTASSMSMSLRAKINSLAKTRGISAQHALQAYFAERFLARVEKSPYAQNLVVKGGTLVSSILGIAQRTTMDVDATIIGIRLDEDAAREIVANIAATDVGDGIVFEIDASEPGTIKKVDDYVGYSIGMRALLGTIKLPISIDLTVGDVITPKAERRCISPVLGDGAAISIYAYTVETLIAEKLQTILHRADANTRPRDFYDLHMLSAKADIDWAILREAVANTFGNRHSEEHLKNWREIMKAVAASRKMQGEWKRYRANAPYARDLEYGEVVKSVESYFERLGC